LNYIDKDGIWNDAHFGVMVANGLVSSDDYEKHLELHAFDIQPLDWKSNRTLRFNDVWPESASVTLDDRPILLGGTSDMGPRALQAFRKTFGEEAVGCDTSHGQNNIAKAAVSASSTFKDAVSHANDLCKNIRRSCRVEISEMEKDAEGCLVLTVPPKAKKIRWGSASFVVNYVVRNLQRISKLSGVSRSLLEKVQTDLQLLTQSRKFFDVLDQSQKFLQALGPCDTFAMPYQMYNVLNKIKSVENSTITRSLRPIRCLIVNRWHRRFFNSLLELPVSYREGRTRKTSFFDNILLKQLGHCFQHTTSTCSSKLV